MAGRLEGVRNVTYEQYLTIKKALATGVGVSTIVELTGVSETPIRKIKEGTHPWDIKINKAEEEKLKTGVSQIDLSGVEKSINNIKIRLDTDSQTIDGALSKLYDLLAETNSKLGQIHTMLCRINTNAGDMSEDMKKLSKGLAD